MMNWNSSLQRTGMMVVFLVPNFSIGSAQTSAELLNYARQSIASMNGIFDGSLSIGAGRTRIPFVVETRSTGGMRYHFSGPAEIISVVVGQMPEKATETIRDTDLTREDLSMWYLTWTPGDFRTENSAGMEFFVVPVENTSRLGAYARADVWIHKNSLGLFRVDAYDAEGQLIRKMDVEHIKAFGDQRIADRLRVSTYRGGRRISATFVQLVNQR